MCQRICAQFSIQQFVVVSNFKCSYPTFGNWYEQTYCRLLEITYFRAKSEKWLNFAWRCYKTEYHCMMNKRIGDVIALFSQISILVTTTTTMATTKQQGCMSHVKNKSFLMVQSHYCIYIFIHTHSILRCYPIQVRE